MKTPLVRTLSICAVISCATALLGCAGCGSDEVTTPEPTSDSIEIKTIDVAGLPIGDALPPGVSKELRISAPLDWKVPGRKSGYIAWFLRWDSSQVPLIALMESTNTYPDAETIDRENAVEYARWIIERLEESDKEPLEEVLVVQFDDRYYVRYVLKGRVGGTVMERQILETQFNGKAYELELRVLPGKLVEFRDAGYAVAASIDFLPPPEADPN